MKALVHDPSMLGFRRNNWQAIRGDLGDQPKGKETYHGTEAMLHHKNGLPEKGTSDWGLELEYLLFLSMFQEKNMFEGDR